MNQEPHSDVTPQSHLQGGDGRLNAQVGVTGRRVAPVEVQRVVAVPKIGLEGTNGENVSSALQLIVQRTQKSARHREQTGQHLCLENFSFFPKNDCDGRDGLSVVPLTVQYFSESLLWDIRA